LFGQDGADEADEGVAVEEDAEQDRPPQASDTLTRCNKALPARDGDIGSAIRWMSG
jgi:hypothetical protein